MIAYMLPASVVGASSVIVATRYGQSATDRARLFIKGPGLRRLTARQLRHELRLTRHELAGAGEYIRRLEQDRRASEGVAAERDDLKAALERAGLRIADLEEQLRDAGRIHEQNTALTSALANVHAIRPLLPAPAHEASALPVDEQEFADDTATAWRARA